MLFLSKIIRNCTQKANFLNVGRNFHRQTKNVNYPLIPIHFTNNPWIWQQNDKIKLPIIQKYEINIPNIKWVPIIEPNINKKEITEIPLNNERKEAVKLIVIRRKKMKKHKLKKLRKRMKFEYAKRRQRRELRKEKEFHRVLIAQCRQAEAFSAEKYVEEKLAKYEELQTKQTNPNLSQQN